MADERFFPYDCDERFRAVLVAGPGCGPTDGGHRERRQLRGHVRSAPPDHFPEPQRWPAPTSRATTGGGRRPACGCRSPMTASRSGPTPRPAVCVHFHDRVRPVIGPRRHSAPTVTVADPTVWSRSSAGSEPARPGLPMLLFADLVATATAVASTSKRHGEGGGARRPAGGASSPLRSRPRSDSSSAGPGRAGWALVGQPSGAAAGVGVRAVAHDRRCRRGDLAHSGDRRSRARWPSARASSGAASRPHRAGGAVPGAVAPGELRQGRSRA